MRRSADRILTTHAGSLPRPADLRELWSKRASSAREEAALQERLRSAVSEVVLAQKQTSIDVPNDGEFAKPMRAATDRGAWGNYIFDRLSGFGPTSPESVAPDKAAPGAPMRIVGVRWEQREFAEFYADTGLGAPSTAASRPTCTGPIAYTAREFLRRHLANLRAATDAAGAEEAFVSSIAPGSLEMFCRAQNRHYATAEAFLEAIAAAMREEYRAVADAGFILQLDDPGLPGAWDMLDPRPSLDEYRRYAMLRVEILNEALKGIPEERVRYHICWGSWHGPHTTDIPLRDVVDIMLCVNAQAYLVEGATRAMSMNTRSGATSSYRQGRSSFPESSAMRPTWSSTPSSLRTGSSPSPTLSAAKTSSPERTAAWAGGCTRRSRGQSCVPCPKARRWRARNFGALEKKLGTNRTHNPYPGDLSPASVGVYTCVVSVNIPLKDMTLHEKLAVMESLWEDLARSPDSIESPAWHKDVLDERRRRIADGTARFADWETAKAAIRKKLP